MSLRSDASRAIQAPKEYPRDPHTAGVDAVVKSQIGDGRGGVLRLADTLIEGSSLSPTPLKLNLKAAIPALLSPVAMAETTVLCRLPP